MTLAPSDALKVLPAGLRKDLLDAFNEIVGNYGQRRWEPAALNGGKLCEAVYTIIRGKADGAYPSRSSKPKNMVNACLAMEHEVAQSRAVRIQIPRMLVALYEIRNNRGVGHAGGEIDPNEMDATAVLYMSKWLMADLVRILHTLTTTEAADVVEALAERQIGLVWRYEDKKRVLKAGLTWKQSTLLLLLSETGDTTESDLLWWVEHKNAAVFRRDILRPGHRDRLWEYDESRHIVRLLPPGIEAAEKIVRIASEK